MARTQMSRQNLTLGLTRDMLNGAAASWKSTRQKSASLSTAGADTSEANKEIVFLRSILKDFGFEQVSPTLLYENSRALIVVTENPEKTIILEQCGTMVEDIQYYHGPGIPFVKASMNVVCYFVNTVS
jgi:hypothetical protein